MIWEIGSVTIITRRRDVREAGVHSVTFAVCPAAVLLIPGLSMDHLVFVAPEIKVPSNQVTSPLTACYERWEKELQNDIDRTFILEGVKNGFYILSPVENPTPVHSTNYKSATCQENRHRVEEQIKKEISKGHYIIVEIFNSYCCSWHFSLFCYNNTLVLLVVKL